MSTAAVAIIDNNVERSLGRTKEHELNGETNDRDGRNTIDSFGTIMVM